MRLCRKQSLQNVVSISFAALLVTLSLNSCSSAKEAKKSEKESTAADAKGDKTPPAATPVQPAEADLNLAGIPTSCRPLDLVQGAKYCIECKPRLLEVQHCFESKGVSDIAKNCSHDGEDVECKDDEGKDIKFSVKPNQVEKAFESMPFVTLAGRALLADKLKDKPKELAMANSALDVLDKHALDIFKGKNTSVVADTIVAEVTKQKANLTKEQLDGIHAASVKALTELAASLKTGKVDLSHIAKSAVDILNILPFDTIGGGSSKLDLNKLREAFAPGGNGIEGLAALVKSMNLGSLEEILKKLQPAATK